MEADAEEVGEGEKETAAPESSGEDAYSAASQVGASLASHRAAAWGSSQPSSMGERRGRVLQAEAKPCVSR